MGRYTHVAGINRGPCVLKHKYQRHWNHGRPRAGFWGILEVPSIEPPWMGGSGRRALSTPPPPPPETKTRFPLDHIPNQKGAGTYPHLDRGWSISPTGNRKGAMQKAWIRAPYQKKPKQMPGAPGVVMLPLYK